MTTEAQHTDVAAYAFGLLEDADRRAFEAHLARCARCTGELPEFSGMTAVLAGVELVRADPAEHEAESGGELIDMMRRRRAAERRRRRATGFFAAAAGVALLAGGVTIGVAGFDGKPAGPPPSGHHSVASGLVGWGETRSATDSRSGVTGTVAMENKRWGTHVALDLGGVKGPLTCELVAVAKSGRRNVVAGWSVPVKGYGVPGSPEHLLIHGGTAVGRTDLARFDVQLEGGGRTLLSIPV
ncbi:anti-sigma factor family protein [Actinomadura sp. HBU206391]|uniref:anti-sigma factor family protein n=1 Tax=Actinomadura sp. HBU206391 TaxID=2731692 RepID=UPI00164F7976|nr:zf-HC2 domain-containing protein [Actinomadura sp. HBU206391]MBC6460485.1 zf-HC2 domain-containing protein [Actinomadura sp. HBU206391]